MAYSYTEHVGTVGGTTGPFSYGSVALLDADTEAISDQLDIYKNGVLLTYTTDYTINTIAKTVTLVANLYNTDLLRIARDTKKDDRYVDYEDSTNVTAELLDLDSNQLFFIVQEAFDLQTDAMTRGTDGQWNARGYRIGNLASGVNGTDAVTVNQLNAAVGGALPGTLSGIGTATYVGDNTTTDFPLPAAINTITSPDDVEVYINGLRQRPSTHYTIVSGNVRITPAPTTIDNILMAYQEGAVSTLLTANSVQTLSIQDDAVTPAKIDEGTNGQVLATVSGNTAWTTIDSTYISNFDTQVRTNRLNQLTAANGNYSMGSNKILDLATPTLTSDAATKGYVDSYTHTFSGTYSQSGSITSLDNTISGLPFTVGSITVNIEIDVDPGAGVSTINLVGTACFTSGKTYVEMNLLTPQGSAVWQLQFARLSATSVKITAQRVSYTGTEPRFIVGGLASYMITRGTS